jgi:signal transduction histidine kinase
VTHEVRPEDTDILVVEDSPTQAERLRRLLQAQGYRARVAGNGALALEALRAGAPDLVISDIVMPEMDGYALCRAIKADAALSHIPVVLVTSLNDTADVLHGIDCGADSLVRKPYSDQYLLQRIGQMLSNQRLRAGADDSTGVGLYFGGKQHVIRAHPQQMLDLLISTYEQAVQVNGELQARERQVVDLNLRLSHHAAELEATNRAIALKNVELAEASRMKTAFIANMSHELRTPLNAIIGFTGALLMKLAGPLTGDQEKQLGTIRTSARHLLALINDILDVAKIEAGKIKIKPERLDGALLVQETVETLRQMALQKNLGLTVRVPEHAVPLVTDRRALTQILLNLVNNALKFTDRGEVRVELRQLESAAGLLTEVAVSDTGTGIRAEDQSKLYQAFSQLDSTATRHAEGAGLGLYLCRNLANLLGGQLELASTFGSGSTFTLVLPEQAPAPVL